MSGAIITRTDRLLARRKATIARLKRELAEAMAINRDLDRRLTMVHESAELASGELYIKLRSALYEWEPTQKQE